MRIFASIIVFIVGSLFNKTHTKIIIVVGNGTAHFCSNGVAN